VRRRTRRKSEESSEIHGDERKCEVDLICSGEHHHDVVAASSMQGNMWVAHVFLKKIGVS
jgi:hypothetical protein